METLRDIDGGTHYLEEIRCMDKILWSATNAIDIEIMETMEQLLFNGMTPHQLLDLLQSAQKKAA